MLSSEKEAINPPPESSNDSAWRNATKAFERLWAALDMAITRICKSVNNTAIIMKEDAASTLRIGSNSGIGVNPYDDSDPKEGKFGASSSIPAVVSIASSSLANNGPYRELLKVVVLLAGAGWRNRFSGLEAEYAVDHTMVVTMFYVVPINPGGRRTKK